MERQAVKAIETSYKGYRFRSRLEARWAVFFDALGIAWEYEPEGFEFEGERYLPDFRLVVPWFVEVFVEVKKSPSTEADWYKAKLLACSGRQNVLLLAGVPRANANTLCMPDGAERFVRFQQRGIRYDNGDNEHGCGPEVHRAVLHARSARFEFGESGARA